jgi:hypothetical protein
LRPLPSPRWRARFWALFLPLCLLLIGNPRLQADLKVPLWVKNAEGEHVQELQPESIRVWFDEEAATVTGVDPPDGNRIILIVMDVVGDIVRVDAARQALVEALQGLHPQHYVALLRAQDGLQIIVEPTNERELIKDSILNLQVSGFPELLGSLEGAAALGHRILSESEVSVATLYITDGSIYDYRGGFTNPVINPSDGGDLTRRFRDSLIQEKITTTLDAVMRSWTPLFFLHLENSRDDLNMVYQNGLRQVAQATGGDIQLCDSPTQIPTYLTQLLEQVTSFHSVNIEVPAEMHGRVKLRLEVDGADEVVYREQFEISKSEKSTERSENRRVP